MRLKFHKTFYFIIFIALHFNVFSQTPEQLLGKPYTSIKITDFLRSIDAQKPTESFLPYLRLYKMDYYAKGISMEYNTDISLYQIALYDSGFSYAQYQNTLPFAVQWGMNIDQIQALAGGLDFVSENQYVRRLSTEDYQMDFYFLDSELYHIRITATLIKIRKNKNDIIAATGIRLIPDGKKIEGNILDGVGTMMWGDGAAKYRGDWSYGLPHGRGQYIDSFGNKYEGEFKLGFFWGQGEFYSKSYKYSYSGSFAMSKKHGEGRIGYANKTSYLGDWQQDKMHGQGTYSIKDRYTYIGTFKENKFTGRGTLNTPDGIIDGYFKDGKPHGVCTQSSADGLQSITGNFKNGKKNGTFKVTMLGSESIITYEDDIEIRQKPVDGTLIDK